MATPFNLTQEEIQRRAQGASSRPSPFAGVEGGSEATRLAVGDASKRLSGLVQRSGASPFDAGIDTPQGGTGITGFSQEGLEGHREGVELRRRFDPGFIEPPLPPINPRNQQGAVLTFEHAIPRMESFSRDRLNPGQRKEFDALSPREKLLLQMEVPSGIARLSPQEIENRAGERGTLFSTAGGGVARILPGDEVKQVIEGQPGPGRLSPIAVLRSNLEAGLITKEDFDREIAQGETRGQTHITINELQSGTKTDLERATFNSVNALARLNQIEQSFDPELLTTAGKTQQALLSAAARVSPSLLTPEQTEQREKGVLLQARTADNLVSLLKELSGAAVTPEEAKRLLQLIPSKDDDPVAFRVKLEESIQRTKLAIARSTLMRQGNKPFSAISLADSRKIFIESADQIMQQILLDPGSDISGAGPAVDMHVRRENAAQQARQQIIDLYGVDPAALVHLEP